METVKEIAVMLVREPRTRVVIAFSVAIWPVIFGGFLWLSTLDLYVQLGIGVITGFALMVGYYYMTLHRTHSRCREAVKLQQLSGLDASVLRRLIPEDSIPSWVQSGFDKVDWINKELREVWPFLDKAVGDMVTQQLQPILDQYKLGPVTGLKVQHVTLGTVGPLIGGIKVTEGGKDESIVEFEVDWRNGKGQKAVITVQTPGPDFQVEVNDFSLYGVGRVVLKPLIEEIPGFGAILVSLREPPDVDFHTNIFGGDLTALPGVDQIIDNLIKSALEDMLVWPSRIVVPVAPGDYSWLELHPVGILHVVLLEGKGIKSGDWFGKSDPFVLLYIRPKEDKIKRSSTKSNTTNPVWNEAFDLEVEDPACQKLHLRLMDADAVSAADYHGGAELAISQFEPLKAYDLWLPLLKDPSKPQEGEPTGQIHVIITYKPLEKKSGDEKVAATQKENGKTEEKDVDEKQDTATDEKKEGDGKTEGADEKEGAEKEEFPTAEKAAGNPGAVPDMAQEPEVPATPEEHDKKLQEHDLGAQHAAALDLNDKSDAKIRGATSSAEELMEMNGMG